MKRDGMTVNQQRVLLVEDEPGIADAVIYALQTEGFEVTHAVTGGEALTAFDEAAPDLVILDVGLPDVSGFDVFHRIRAAGQTPVIFLTARNSEVDRVAGLEMGADDYVTKPFSPRELTARVRAVLRRAPRLLSTVASEPTPFSLDTQRRRITYFDVPLTLSRYEYGILSVLVRRPGVVFSREQLMALAWDVPDVSDPRTEDAHVKMIRSRCRAIRPDVDPIVTHRGVGYALRETW